MRSVSFSGVIIGGIIGIVFTNILMIPFEITIHAHPVIYVTATILGCAGSVLGGYAAALLATHDEVLNGALSSFLYIGAATYGIIRGTSTEPVWIEIAMLPLSVGLAALGGRLALTSISRRTTGF